jgi:hypothetical protein
LSAVVLNWDESRGPLLIRENSSRIYYVHVDVGPIEKGGTLLEVQLFSWADRHRHSARVTSKQWLEHSRIGLVGGLSVDDLSFYNHVRYIITKQSSIRLHWHVLSATLIGLPESAGGKIKCLDQKAATLRTASSYLQLTPHCFIALLWLRLVTCYSCFVRRLSFKISFNYIREETKVK